MSRLVSRRSNANGEPRARRTRVIERCAACGSGLCLMAASVSKRDEYGAHYCVRCENCWRSWPSGMMVQEKTDLGISRSHVTPQRAVTRVTDHG